MTRKPDNPAAPDDPLWYKDAIIYQLHVKAFCDSNGDGIGDFAGLAQKLDYVQDLGVNTIWLLPFYPSPLRDDGYDIANYRSVHPDYGTLRDFRHFVREAHRRGIRVITELVINHTSDQHPWFQAARKSPPGSIKRNYYVWSDNDKKYAGTRIIFTDTESSNWAWDPVAQSYYWHRFFSHQPDLNFDNPHVVKAIMRVMHFWLDIGVDGLRLDAIPYLCERDGTNNENLPETHAVLKQMRAELDRRHRGKMFLAEANQWPEDVRPYFGDADECHMAFHFPLMPRIYMAVAMEDRHPVVEIMEQTPEIPDSCQWTIFLRNHDELTLEMVTDDERDYMYQVYAQDKRMRVNVGIRRRLAPLVENDVERIKLLNNLLMSMPGSPIIYYGDEIGMGDNIFLGDRNGVRTPMQWSPDRNAGFSRADPQRLYLPPVMDPVYGYEAVNVEAQLRDPSSLLNWTRRLLAVRKAYQAFGRGTLKFLKPGNRKILAYLREYEDQSVLCVCNLSRAAQPVELDLSAYKGKVPVEMLGRASFPPIGDLPYLLTLPGFGFYWFRLTTDAWAPRWHEERLPPLELPVLVMFAGWDTLFPERIEGSDRARKPLAEKLRGTLEREVWPKFIATERWYAAKGRAIERVEWHEPGEWTSGNNTWMLSLIDVLGDAAAQRYFMPMALVWDEGDDERNRSLLHRALARVRRGSRTGVLCDAFADEIFCRTLVQAMAENREVDLSRGRLRFRATEAFQAHAGAELSSLTVRTLGLEQSNTSMILGDRFILKAYRRVQEGTNPELEVGRFLTEVVPYQHIAQIAGYVEFQPQGGDVITLAILQNFVANQGDAWIYTRDYLERLLEEHRIEMPETRALQLEAAQVAYFTFVRQLGRRTGELHHALARRTGDPAFDPEPVSAGDLKGWVESVRAQAHETMAKLEQRLADLPETARHDGRELLSSRDALTRRLDEFNALDLKTYKTRYHGDFHLAQALVVHNDIVIIDFEGEPGRPPAERRRKHSPLKDVAGMVRSFNYASYIALYSVTRERPEDVAVLAPHARRWEQEARRIFLSAYAEAVQGSGLFDDSSEQVERLRNLFVLEKALYELRYELDNRPDWARLPIRGILDFLHTPSEDGDDAPSQ